MRQNTTERQHGYISPKEAQRLTKMSPAALAKLGRDGALGCIFGKGSSKTPVLYSRSDVEELVDIRRQGKSLAALQQQCLEARLCAKRALSAVNRLERAIGIIEGSNLSEAEVIQIHEEAERILRDRSGDITVDMVYEWGIRLLRTDEAAIEAAVAHLGGAPWEALTAVGNYLSRCASREQHNPLMSTAQGYLELGRRNLRNVIALMHNDKQSYDSKIERLIKAIVLVLVGRPCVATD